jgi:hypothetical protein
MKAVEHEESIDEDGGELSDERKEKLLYLKSLINGIIDNNKFDDAVEYLETVIQPKKI